MTKIFILFVASYTHGGEYVTTQEFTSLAQCQYVADLLNNKSRIHWAECFAK
jgi:hypothetical protein